MELIMMKFKIMIMNIELVIAKYGIKIIRFTNDEVEKNLEWVIIALKQAIEERAKEIH